MLKNFKPIGKISSCDLEPLINALNTSDLWNNNDLRTKFDNSPHSAVDDIWIRFNDLTKDQDVLNNKECIWYDAVTTLPVSNIIYQLMQFVGADRIGRVIITRMKPGGKIEPHEDHGEPATYYQRFHLAIKNSSGASFKCGDEEYEPIPGEIFLVNNKLTHQVENNSMADRITMIIDLHTKFFEDFKQTQ